MNKSKTLRVRVSEGDLLLIDYRAKVRGLDTSEYLRDVGTGHPVASHALRDVLRTERLGNAIQKLGEAVDGLRIPEAEKYLLLNLASEVRNITLEPEGEEQAPLRGL